MIKHIRWSAVVFMLAAVAASWSGPRPAGAASAVGLNEDADAALRKLYQSSPVAKTIAGKARAILIFPSIVKAGFVVGAQYGEGVLRTDGKTVGYYNSVAGSYGLQAGVQSFGYVLFLMTDSAVG